MFQLPTSNFQHTSIEKIYTSSRIQILQYQTSMTKRNLIVLSSVPPPPESTTTTTTGSYTLDLLDDFNHPRQRRDIILNALQQHANCSANDEEEAANTVQITFAFDTSTSTAAKAMSIEELSTLFHGLYSTVHSTPLLTFGDGLGQMGGLGS